jgi:phage baseplate assembly protein W
MNGGTYGFAFPFRIVAGGVAGESDDDKLKQDIAHLLLTGIGERVMRRDYGGGLRRILHDPNNDALRAIVQHQIAKAIATYEPRVLVQSVAVTQSQGTLSIDLRYVVRRTRVANQLSVPVSLAGL